MKWLKREEKERAVVAGGEDWEKRLKQMLQIAESNTINGKLGTVLNGRFSPALDRIEVHARDWFRVMKYTIMMGVTLKLIRPQTWGYTIPVVP